MSEEQRWALAVLGAVLRYLPDSVFLLLERTFEILPQYRRPQVGLGTSVFRLIKNIFEDLTAFESILKAFQSGNLLLHYPTYIKITADLTFVGRFITLAHTQLEEKDFNTCLQLMLQRGQQFLAKLTEARGKICVSVQPFIQASRKDFCWWLFSWDCEKKIFYTV